MYNTQGDPERAIQIRFLCYPGNCFSTYIRHQKDLLSVVALDERVIDVKYSGSVICAIATVAALRELSTVITKDRINN